MMRINKFLANSGVASRRNSDKLVEEGRIKVNGQVIDTPGYKVNEINDVVEFDGKIVTLIEKKYYFMLNKPVGYASTNSKKFNKKIIFDLIESDEKLFSIGRLDKDSRGLILITNDGDIYNNVIHPRSEIYKTYLVTLDKRFSIKHKYVLENGVDIGGYVTNPSIIEILNDKLIKIKINEGKNRQIRRMFASLNYKVVDLNRISIGEIRLNNLPIGEYRDLSDKEIEYLRNL